MYSTKDGAKVWPLPLWKQIFEYIFIVVDPSDAAAQILNLRTFLLLENISKYFAMLMMTIHHQLTYHLLQYIINKAACIGTLSTGGLTPGEITISPPPPFTWIWNNGMQLFSGNISCCFLFLIHSLFFVLFFLLYSLILLAKIFHLSLRFIPCLGAYIRLIILLSTLLLKDNGHYTLEVQGIDTKINEKEKKVKDNIIINRIIGVHQILKVVQGEKRVVYIN
ncbi:hypothetical protein ACJX0J_028836 [Zea mays]